MLVSVMVLAIGLREVSAAPKGEPGIRLIGQPQYDEVLDAMFSLGMAPDGSAWTQLVSGDLKVEKWATAAGEATLVLNYLKDRVTFTLRDGTYTVSRGKRSVSLSASDQNDDRYSAVRMLLVGSPAVRAFRAFTAAMEHRTGEDTGVMISMMVDGALVGVLDGDVGAIERVARRLARRARPGVRQAQGAMPVQFTDCVTAYELAVLAAWNAYVGCLNYSFWQYLFFAPVCALEWGFRSQQYAFQYISCMAVPH
jgi:hypothetical protein